MSFCVAGVALCDIPSCLITCRKCQNWRKSRTKCSFSCPHVSLVESLVFPWLRRVYGGSRKTYLFRRFPMQVVVSFCVAGVALCDIPTCLTTFRKCQNWRKSRTKCWFFCAHTCLVSSLWFSCGVAVSMGEAPHSTLYTLHSTLHTLHCTLLTPHSTLYKSGLISCWIGRIAFL